MLLAEQTLLRFQCPPKMCLRLAIAAQGAIKFRQIIDAKERVGMVFAERAFSKRDNLLGYCGRLLVFAFTIEVDNLLIESGDVICTLRRRAVSSMARRIESVTVSA